MERPPELDNLDDLEARVKAWAEHTNAEYDRAEKTYQELVQRHCGEAREQMDRWARENGRARALLAMLENARHQRAVILGRP